MPAVSLVRELEGWLAEEIGAQCLGEAYKFAVHPVTMLAPPENGIRYNIIIGRANPLLGQAPLLIGYAVTNPFPARELVTAMVDDALGKLRALATDLLAAPNGKPA